MAKRLLVVTAPFTATHTGTGKQRMLKTRETLFAEYPAQSMGLVIFEQDGDEFQAEAAIFVTSTALDKA